LQVLHFRCFQSGLSVMLSDRTFYWSFGSARLKRCSWLGRPQHRIGTNARGGKNHNSYAISDRPLLALRSRDTLQLRKPRSCARTSPIAQAPPAQ
jgi:hypothetical protein